MKIMIGNDHAGVEMKKLLTQQLQEWGHEVINRGTDSIDSVNYPEFGKEVANAVVKEEADLGIIICGTGIGISIAANKVKGARAAVCTNELMADLARRHNNAYVLALGARIVGDELAIAITKAFVEGKFEGGRHGTRVDLIESYRC